MAILDRDDPVVIIRREEDSMGWFAWLLVGASVGAVLLLTRKELPAVRRYMKIRSM